MTSTTKKQPQHHPVTKPAADVEIDDLPEYVPRDAGSSHGHAEPAAASPKRDDVVTAVDTDAVTFPAPTVGRIVLYTSAGEKGALGEVQPAVITGVDGETCALRVWSRTSEFVVAKAAHTMLSAGSPDAQGCWSWPVKV